MNNLIDKFEKKRHSHVLYSLPLAMKMALNVF